MFDFRSHYALVKSVMTDKAKAEIKPSLNDKASMQAYAKATGNTGKAKFIGMDDDLACYQLDFTL
ncbi:hypothetical protein [Pseudomonas phage vB_PsaM_M1]|nr:hypothetical protein [Pseudomonas phage vB_PsaM_M1]